jgi:hypothetical protein
VHVPAIPVERSAVGRRSSWPASRHDGQAIRYPAGRVARRSLPEAVGGGGGVIQLAADLQGDVRVTQRRREGAKRQQVLWWPDSATSRGPRSRRVPITARRLRSSAAGPVRISHHRLPQQGW